VNRNIIGAVVGVQPFGGSGLSGTGPKAGGPLYLGRLVRRPPPAALDGLAAGDGRSLRHYRNWLRATERAGIADRLADRFPAVAEIVLAGPVGERNLYGLRPRGRVAALAQTEAGLLLQLGAILATGNRALVVGTARSPGILTDLPAELAARVECVASLDAAGELRAILFEGDADGLQALNRAVAARPGPILSVQARTPEALAGGDLYAPTGLVEEISTAIDTAAAGGNASLMSVG
jgi:RHH-type proline utilization regulon transcriptional repressor/proline dehydrogenase/delta 1-pyrroline-5-carboxylate dehydrogenase